MSNDLTRVLAKAVLHEINGKTKVKSSGTKIASGSRNITIKTIAPFSK